MEFLPSKFVGLHQFANVNALECMSNLRTRGRQDGPRVNDYPGQVICPEPRRAASSFILDSCNWFNYRTERDWCKLNEDAGKELLNIILTKEAAEESDDNCSCFCGSPPARATNPMIHDVQFTGQSSFCCSLTPPSNSSLGSKPSSSSRVDSCCSSSYGGSFGREPMVRIEGFPSGNSKSNCFVQAFA